MGENSVLALPWAFNETFAVIYKMTIPIYVNPLTSVTSSHSA